MTAARRELTVDGVTLGLSLSRKRVRNVNARLVGDELRVSAPLRVPDEELDEIIEQLARRLLRRRRADQVNSGEHALTVAKQVAARFATDLKVSDVRFVTTQRARWGSYSLRTGIVRLHAALATMPPWVLEAVVAHELVHAVIPDHSPEFWRLVREICPATDRARAFLEGVSWLARSWDRLPPVERSLLSQS